MEKCDPLFVYKMRKWDDCVILSRIQSDYYIPLLLTLDKCKMTRGWGGGWGVGVGNQTVENCEMNEQGWI